MIINSKTYEDFKARGWFLGGADWGIVGKDYQHFEKPL
jgi:hypothetical protein